MSIPTGTRTTPPATFESPGEMERDPPAAMAQFSSVMNLLGEGVPVALTKDSSAKRASVEEYGILSLDETSMMFAAKKPRKVWTTVKLSSIDSVRLQQQASPGQESPCRITLKEGAPGSSFRFVCTDSGCGLPSSQLTEAVANVLKYKTSDHEQPSSPVIQASTFEELLQPLGLVDKYFAAFADSGIPFENLRAVTREDLAELMNVHDRRDQVNIMAQIQRRFLDSPRCCCRGRGAERGLAGPDMGGAGSAMEGVGSAVQGFGSMFQALAGV